MKIEQTTIYSNLKQSMYTDGGFDISEGDLHVMFDAIFGSMTVFLSRIKSTTESVALAIRDEKGAFKLGGKVYYENPTEEGMPGNWVYVMSFDEFDIINETDKVMEYTDMAFQTTLAIYIQNEFHIRLSNTFIIIPMINIAVQTLLNWLDENAKDKEVELEIGDYATAVTVIEKGKKVFSITPSAKMKQLIKDDDQAASNAALMESDAKAAARSHVQAFIRTVPVAITNPFNHMD